MTLSRRTQEITTIQYRRVWCILGPRSRGVLASELTGLSSKMHRLEEQKKTLHERARALAEECAAAHRQGGGVMIMQNFWRIPDSGVLDHKTWFEGNLYYYVTVERMIMMLRSFDCVTDSKSYYRGYKPIYPPLKTQANP